MPELKSSPFPVISPESMDYTDAEYAVKVIRLRNENKVEVRHVLRGENLVAQMLRDGRAAFACIVSLPSTMYRKIFVAPADALEYSQTVDYSKSGHGAKGFSLESPMFRPVIVAQKETALSANRAHGLNALWSDADIRIPGGGIIAYSEWERFNGAMGGLLVVRFKEGLKDGAIMVEPDIGGGFRFIVNVGGKNLFRLLESPHSAEAQYQRSSVLTHALSSGFAILKEMYGNNEDWREYTNLRMLSQKLKDDSLRDWTEDGFSPDYAASCLNPHDFRYQTGEDDD